MSNPPRIGFASGRIAHLTDMADILDLLFPGNRNQRYAAARILIELKSQDHIVPSLAYLEKKHGISRRTLERVRAKLSRLGLIEHVSAMNSRYGGQAGWKLSTRFSSALRLLADKVEEWRRNKMPQHIEREGVLADLLR
jgi:DNA-binding transcriptional regulator YhcF (GntR family)